MLFTEKDLLNAFKQNVDNKGWIYFVGNPDSNAKFIINYMKEHKEEINEEKLDNLAETYFLNTYNNGFKDPNLEIINEKEFAVADFKAGYVEGANKQRQIDIEKACEWLNEILYEYVPTTTNALYDEFTKEEFIEVFRKAMEEE